jgi:hypothetical protein
VSVPLEVKSCILNPSTVVSEPPEPRNLLPFLCPNPEAGLLPKVPIMGIYISPYAN